MGGAGAAWAIALAAMTLVSAQANAGPSVWNGDEAQQQRPAPQTTPRPANDATLSSWMRSWHQASDMCRGTYPGAEHDHWCQLSAIYGSKLEHEGCHTVLLGTAMSSVRWACPNSLSGDR